MNEKVDYLIKNSNNLNEVLLKQKRNFEKKDLNYKTLLKLTHNGKR